MMFERILVATDFSPTASRAIDAAVDLARRFGGTLSVAHAFELVPQAYPFLSAEEESRAAAQRELDRVVAEVRARGVKAEGVLREGPPSEQIVRAADELRADLVVVGSHGWRGFNRVLLGSVAEKVVRLSRVPVLTIHAWRFEDRADAGRELGKALAHLRGETPLVLATTASSVVVASEVARSLGASFDVLFTEALEQEGRVFGGISERGAARMDAEAASRVAAAARGRIEEQAKTELREEAQEIRGQRRIPEPWSRTVVLVSDGLATPWPILAAADVVRGMGAERIILAAPAAAPAVVDVLQEQGVESVVIEALSSHAAVADAYRDFGKPSRRAARALLEVPLAPATP